MTVVTADPALPDDLAHLLGVRPAGHPECPQRPNINLDAALDWAGQGFYVFPCKPMLGTPLVEKSWYTAATTSDPVIVNWWADSPAADIGAVPERSGHFVVCAFEDEGGRESLSAFEEEHGEIPADLFYEDIWGNVFLWLKGTAYTSHHVLGRGVHVLGRGHRVFLPPSVALHTVYR
jgi:hypothetical protein